MIENTWKRWGEDDERGALNFIGPDQVRRATGLVQTGEVLRLAQLLSSKTPVPAHRCGLQHFMGRDGGDYAAGAGRPEGFQFAEDSVIMPLHIGTHVDALCHAWYDDTLYNGFSGDTIRSTTGASRLGVEKMPPIVTRGVLLDLVRLKGRVLVPGEVISRADLEAAAAMADLKIERGDAVLLRTGWLESQKGVKNVSFDVEPGIDVEAARWLAECEVAVVGADNFAVEVLPFAKGTVFPVHQLLIRDFGVPLLEGLMLDPLVASGRYTFLFVASALPIVGATGSPLAPVAVL
ncbi:cyclase family protein [Glaciimonas sp. PAMC28666]|uniref:cyclase family protein n=1 Tax=Glaciimonas sp. PAMC28666 TaxID=2807626 RepID=UPI001963C10F|nr:cyclase family protein [Glaciimonas sp. PAMC28666]QRX81107.1 cyclase family protein [Glaciimonas sp. PAMC28666]